MFACDFKNYKKIGRESWRRQRSWRRRHIPSPSAYSASSLRSLRSLSLLFDFMPPNFEHTPGKLDRPVPLQFSALSAIIKVYIQ